MVRIKHRYLLVHILDPTPLAVKLNTNLPITEILPDVVQFHPPSPDDLTPQILAGAIKNQIRYLYGDYGLGLVASSLVVKYLSPATSTAIIRCSRNHYRLAWSALSFMTHLPSTPSQQQPHPCVMRVVRVSGTIKKAEEEAIKRARAAIMKARRGSDAGTDGLLGFLSKEQEQKQALESEGGKIMAESIPNQDDGMPTDPDEDG